MLETTIYLRIIISPLEYGVTTCNFTPLRKTASAKHFNWCQIIFLVSRQMTSSKNEGEKLGTQKNWILALNSTHTWIVNRLCNKWLATVCARCTKLQRYIGRIVLAKQRGQRRVWLQCEGTEDDLGCDKIMRLCIFSSLMLLTEDYCMTHAT